MSGLLRKKHSHIHNVMLSRLSGTRTTRLLQALDCRCLRVVIRGHSRIMFCSIVVMRILSVGGGRGTVSLGIVSPGAIAGYGTLHIIHWGDFVFTNVAPTNNNGQICGLRKVNLSDKSLHDPQRFGQGLVLSSEIGRPLVTTLTLPKFFEKSASRLKILST